MKSRFLNDLTLIET